MDVTTSADTLPYLASCLWEQILCVLDIETLHSSIFVCKEWQQTLSTPAMWKNAYRLRCQDRGGPLPAIENHIAQMGNWTPAVSRKIASQYKKEFCYKGNGSKCGNRFPHLKNVPEPYRTMLILARKSGPTSTTRGESFAKWNEYYGFYDNSYCFTSWTFFNDIGEPMDFVFEFGYTCKSCKESTIYVVLWAIPYGGNRFAIYQGAVDTWRNHGFPAGKVKYYYKNKNIYRLFHYWLPGTATLKEFGKHLFEFLWNRMKRFYVSPDWNQEYTALLGHSWPEVTDTSPESGWRGWDQFHGRWSVY